MANLNTKFQKDRDLASEEIDARIRDYKKDSSPKNWNALIDATFRVISLSSLSKTKFYEVLEVLGLEIKVNDVERYMDDPKELLKRGEKGIESNNTPSH